MPILSKLTDSELQTLLKEATEHPELFGDGAKEQITAFIHRRKKEGWAVGEWTPKKRGGWHKHSELHAKAARKGHLRRRGF